MTTLKDQLLAATLVLIDGELYKAAAVEDGVLLTDAQPDPHSDILLGEIAYGDRELNQFQPDAEIPGLWRDDAKRALRILDTAGGQPPRLLKVKVLSDQDVFDAPTRAVVSVSQELAARIRRLASAVIDLDCYCIEDYDYTPDYYGASDEDPRIDVSRLVVTRSDFWWEGYLKYCDVPIQTDATPISDLR